MLICILRRSYERRPVYTWKLANTQLLIFAQLAVIWLKIVQAAGVYSARPTGVFVAVGHYSYVGPRAIHLCYTYQCTLHVYVPMYGSTLVVHW